MEVPPNRDPELQPALPVAAKLLGSPDLVQYCDRWGLRPVLRYSNAWGYRCARTAGLVGNRQGDQYVNIPDACAKTFPAARVVDHYSDYADPTSWGCYA